MPTATSWAPSSTAALELMRPLYKALEHQNNAKLFSEHSNELLEGKAKQAPEHSKRGRAVHS